MVGVGSASMKKSKPDPILVMDYRQYRRARRLVHECCNYDSGNCIVLDKELETVPFHRLGTKRCAICGALFTPVQTGPNTARNVRRRRGQCRQLEGKNSL